MRPARFQLLLLTFSVLIQAYMTEALAVDNTFNSLRNAIRLYEVRTDHANRMVPLAFAAVPQDVDVNSVIRIDVSPEKLIGDARPLSPESRKMIVSLKAAAAELGKAIQLIGDTLSDTNRLIGIQDRNSEAFNALSTIVEKRLGQWAQSLQSYVKALADAPDASVRQREEVVNQKIRRALGVSGGTGRRYEMMIHALRSEIGWITETVNRAAAKASEKAPTVALVLVARAFVEGQGVQRIHLPHYDNLVPGQIQSLAKINWEADSAEIRRLLEAARPVAEAITQVNARKDRLGDSLIKIFDAQGLDMRPLTASLEELKTSIETLTKRDWSEESKKLIEEIAVLPSTEELVEGQADLLEEMRTLVETAETDIDEIMNGFKVFEASLASNSLDNLIRRVNREAGQVDALLAFLDSVDSSLLLARQLEEGVEAFAHLLQRQLESLQSQLKSVNALLEKFDALSDNLKRALESKIAAFIELHMLDVVSRCNEAHARANSLLERVKTLTEEQKTAVLDYAATDFPVPEDALYVLGNQVKDTYLDLRTIANRKEKSTIAIDARLFRATRLPAVEAGGEPRLRIDDKLDREIQQFIVWRFGLYSVPNVGVAYVQSQNAPEGLTDEASQFSIQTSWLFGYRSWIHKTSNLRPALQHQPWWNDFRLGPHAVALDMNNDNQQEVGFGLTLSYRDLIQIGYGFNLAVDNEPYYFIALQLLDFGRPLEVDSRTYEATAHRE
jgi:ABC-type transporter Mla subunit MlaD